MKIICAGLPKTGTTSMAKALEILGFKVYDWKEHVTIHVDEWLDIYLKGKTPDFASMYKDVDAVTDHPAGFWYEEILQAFPDAMVILNVRVSEDVWLKSKVRENDVDMYLNAGFLVRWLMRNWSYRKYYALLDCMNVAAVGSLQTESTVLFRKKYREHNERVQTVIPKERLLVYNVKQGWEPLCMFLGCEVPQESFPWVNRGQGGTLEALAQRKQELAVKVVKVFIIFMGLFVLFFSCCYMKF